jgi:hypothetical protein
MRYREPVLPPNEQVAQPPGRPLRLQPTKADNAGPVGCSALFGGLPPTPPRRTPPPECGTWFGVLCSLPGCPAGGRGLYQSEGAVHSGPGL